jgi:hypothetical protein
MVATTEINTFSKLKCAVRELAMRRSVYPRRVLEGRMDKRTAIREIELMEAIVADYQRRARDESP